jgi:hypothetical protein
MCAGSNPGPSPPAKISSRRSRGSRTGRTRAEMVANWLAFVRFPAVLRGVSAIARPYSAPFRRAFEAEKAWWRVEMEANAAPFDATAPCGGALCTPRRGQEPRDLRHQRVGAANVEAPRGVARPKARTLQIATFRAKVRVATLRSRPRCHFQPSGVSPAKGAGGVEHAPKLAPNTPVSVRLDVTVSREAREAPRSDSAGRRETARSRPQPPQTARNRDPGRLAGPTPRAPWRP